MTKHTDEEINEAAARFEQWAVGVSRQVARQRYAEKTTA